MQQQAGQKVPFEFQERIHKIDMNQKKESSRIKEATAREEIEECERDQA